jgi:hypothetical protein
MAIHSNRMSHFSNERNEGQNIHITVGTKGYILITSEFCIIETFVINLQNTNVSIFYKYETQRAGQQLENSEITRTYFFGSI